MRAQLKRERQLAGYTQEELALILGISQQTVSKYELGKLTPGHFVILRRYETVLKTPAEKLFPDVFDTH